MADVYVFTVTDPTTGTKQRVKIRGARSKGHAEILLKGQMTKRQLESEGHGPRLDQMKAGTADMNRKAEAGVVESQEPMLAKTAAFLSGVPFVGEGMDEAAAGLASLAGADYDESVRRMRLAREGLYERAPVQYGMLKGAGMVAGGVPMAATAAAATPAAAVPSSVAMRSLAGAGAGIVGGGIEGASQGYLAGETPEDRAQKRREWGVLGAGMGGVVGGAAPAVARGVGDVVNYIGQQRATKGLANALRASRESVGRMAHGLRGSDVADVDAAMRRAGREAMPVDASPALVNQLDHAQQVTGGVPSKNAINQRALQSQQTLKGTLDRTLGPVLRGPRAPRREALRNLYQRAYDTPLPYGANSGAERRAIDQLNEIVSDLAGNQHGAQALREADSLLKIDPNYSGRKNIIARVAPDGTVEYVEKMGVEELDAVSRILQDRGWGTEGAGAMGGKTPLGRAMAARGKQIRDIVRKLAPDYDEALKVGADDIGAMKAYDAGFQVLRPGVTRREVRDLVSGLTPEQRQEVAAGMREYLDEAMARVTKTVSAGGADEMTIREATKGLRDLSSRASREKVAAVVGEDAAERLFRDLERASTGIELKAQLAMNSKTYMRQEMARQDRALQDGPINQLAEGSPFKAAQQAQATAFGRNPVQQAQADVARLTDLERALTNVPPGRFPNSRGARSRGVVDALMDLNNRRLPQIAAQSQRAGQAAGRLGPAAYLGLNEKYRRR